MWQAVLCVFLGSGFGGALRYLVSVGFQAAGLDNGRWMLPWATLLVNIAGCFLFGIVFAAGMSGVVSREWKLGLTTGFCGGLTTYSTFSFETLTMISEGSFLNAAGYALLSILLGLVAAWAGYAMLK